MTMIDPKKKMINIDVARQKMTAQVAEAASGKHQYSVKTETIEDYSANTYEIPLEEDTKRQKKLVIKVTFQKELRNGRREVYCVYSAMEVHDMTEEKTLVFSCRHLDGALKEYREL